MNKPKARLFETPHADPEQCQPLTMDDLKLCAKAKALLESLSPRIRPRQLSERFPQIMNQIALLWRRPVQLDLYFKELLTDRRGDRQGFPFPVALELSTLKEYHQSEVYPKKKDCVWPKGSRRSRP